MVDVAIVVAIALGALAGWRRGFLVPVIAQAGALLGVVALFDGPFAALVPRGGAALAVGAGALLGGTVLVGVVAGPMVSLLHRFEAAREVDRALGVPLGALASAVVLYVALVATVTLDGWLRPFHSGSAINPSDVLALQQTVASNPAAAAFINPAALQVLAIAATQGPVQLGDLGKFDKLLAAYEENVRPQLLASRLAPALLAAGEGLPFVGRPVTFPTK